MITDQDYRLARRNLIGGASVILAHGIGWLEDEWQRIVQIKIKAGGYFGKMLASGEWVEIDQLRYS